MATTGSFATRDGVALAYSVHRAQADAAPRLVLVHSLALDRSVWDGVVSALAGSAEILAYDCRGHGQSTRRAGAYTADSFADDLAGLLDHLGWDRVAVAGCSMGGNVSLAFAGRQPARVTHLGLVDTTAWYGPDAPAKFRERADAARAKGLAALADFQVTRWFTDAFRAGHPDVVRRALDVFVANDVECYASTCALLGDADLRPCLPLLTMPVTIVVGEEDYATPVAMSQHLHGSLPQSTLTILPNGRHLTPIERPGDVAAELAALLHR